MLQQRSRRPAERAANLCGRRPGVRRRRRDGDRSPQGRKPNSVRIVEHERRNDSLSSVSLSCPAGTHRLESISTRAALVLDISSRIEGFAYSCVGHAGAAPFFTVPTRIRHRPLGLADDVLMRPAAASYSRITELRSGFRPGEWSILSSPPASAAGRCTGIVCITHHIFDSPLLASSDIDSAPQAVSTRS